MRRLAVALARLAARLALLRRLRLALAERLAGLRLAAQWRRLARRLVELGATALAGTRLARVGLALRRQRLLQGRLLRLRLWLRLRLRHEHRLLHGMRAAVLRVVAVVAIVAHGLARRQRHRLATRLVAGDRLR